MKNYCLLLALLLSPALARAEAPLRPPSVPLVAHDPYFSIWSPADQLAATNTTHWTGKPHRLGSFVSIDGKHFRVIGNEPGDVPVLDQKSLTVLPTRTIYTFEGAGVALTLTFMTSALPDDLDILSRPVTYLTYEFRAMDGKEHNVLLAFDATAELAVNTPNEEVVWAETEMDDLLTIKIGSKDQPILAKRGDDIRIDWGYCYVATAKMAKPDCSVWPRDTWREIFRLTAQTAPLFKATPAVAPADTKVAVLTFQLGKVGTTPVSRWLMLAYDDLYSIQYMKRNLRPYWRRGRWQTMDGKDMSKFFSAPMLEHIAPSKPTVLEATNAPGIAWVGLQPPSSAIPKIPPRQPTIVQGPPGYTGRIQFRGWEAADLLKAAARDYESLKKRCEAFDEELMSDLTRAGGEKYAKLCALAYRQCFAGGKFVADANGKPLQFCKENHSNGCISTSDVFYPMAPQFLLFGPTLAKSFLVPFMNYAASERWRFPFAPHDLGQYPHANGQRYGGGERTEENQMPVEESGNLLILMAAIAQMEGNADFASLYWKQLEQWAEYLKAKGFDPENQLCTDDFAGHLAHNVNLSAKAICGLGAFGRLCEMRGEKTKAAEYMKLAKEFAARWVKEADDGDHFRLAFDKPGSWSQKYNLIWDRILDLNLFPAEVAKKEMAYYRKMQNKYCLPLDNRKDYTKLDWITWTATLTQDRGDFEALIEPIWKFMNETPDRSPLTDWYWTQDAKKRGFTARPVIGGVFAQMLYDKAVWKKYASRDKTKASGWAPMPVAPIVRTVVPNAREDANITWRYTTQKPADGWFKPGFDDASWKEGKAGFGSPKTPGAKMRTLWKTADIWLRREFDLPASATGDLRLSLHHDEDAEVFINGVLAAQVTGYVQDYEETPLLPAGRAALKPGKNLIAVHCHQTTGGQYIDVGIVDVR
ncbi:MAG: DUF4965 domain-containing protein [Verrucomicrobia bacterium]|nr:DUF4965 domain-containing protein [Verrucomicrobiota bacterium]